MITSYRDLKVWQKAMEIVTEIYSVTKEFPKDELYGLTNQVRRAAVSVPANIAEGSSRASTKTYIQFLNISRGSLAEVETLLMISNNLNYISKEKLTVLIAHTEETGRMLNGLINSLNKTLITTEA